MMYPITDEGSMIVKRGWMISIEGNDGAGKTTAARLLEKQLQEKGFQSILTREPGGSPIAEQIREVLLRKGNNMDARTEALLYAAARREHYVKTIEPALKEGKIVLCDRFLDSSLAYQGAGRNLGMEAIESINDFGLEGFRPDLTLFFEIDPKTAEERMISRGDLNRLDLESAPFHARVREGFEALAAMHPDRFVRIDASGTIESNTEKALQAVMERMEQYED